MWDPFPFAALRSPLCTAILSSRLVFVSVGFCWLRVTMWSSCVVHVLEWTVACCQVPHGPWPGVLLSLEGGARGATADAERCSASSVEPSNGEWRNAPKIYNNRDFSTRTTFTTLQRVVPSGLLRDRVSVVYAPWRSPKMPGAEQRGCAFLGTELLRVAENFGSCSSNHSDWAATDGGWSCSWRHAGHRPRAHWQEAGRRQVE
jgi:hypothetical protein